MKLTLEKVLADPDLMKRLGYRPSPDGQMLEVDWTSPVWHGPPAPDEVGLSTEQANTVARLSVLFGRGKVRQFAPHEGSTTWVWFQTANQDWGIDTAGNVRGWNNLQVPDEDRSWMDKARGWFG